MLIDELQDRYGKRERLRGFFEFAANLPPSMEYNRIEYVDVAPNKVNRLRNRFNKKAFKRRMYQWFGGMYGPQLVKMGVPNSEIDQMVREGLRPKSRDGHRFDFTIDHITSLSMGGQNRLKNLCFLPGKLNHFKNVLESLQLTDPAQKPRSVLTIMPVKIDGRRCGVPISRTATKSGL